MRVNPNFKLIKLTTYHFLSTNSATVFGVQYFSVCVDRDKLGLDLQVVLIVRPILFLDYNYIFAHKILGMLLR